MKLAFHIVDYTLPGGAAMLGPDLAAVARAAEETGFEAIAVADHLWQNPHIGGPDREMLEAYAVLAFLAAETERVRLLTLATAASYRAPAMLAKIVTTIDVLSGGRAGLGVGAGHDAGEATGLGLFLPPMRERFEVLEETIQVCLRMWSGDHGDDGPFAGRHSRLGRALNLPQSLSRPHPPLLVAGGGETRTLRLVARYADACGLYPTPDLPHKLDVLRRHCEAEGTDYDRIEKTAVLVVDVGAAGSIAGAADAAIAGLRRQSGLGIETAFVQVRPAATAEVVGELGRLLVPAAAAF